MTVLTQVQSLAPEVLKALGVAGYQGVTVAEVRSFSGVHHGIASGTLSRLHRDGQIDRLTVRRQGCKVYVLPEYVRGRETEPQGRVRVNAYA